MRPFIFVTLAAFSLLFVTCKEDSISSGSDYVPIDLANDYFPVVPSYQWTFNGNCFSDSGKTYSNFDYKVDTATFRNGVFKAVKVRLPGGSQWYPIFGIKDSGNIIYSLTDNPPVSNPLPAFKHTYDANEGVRETISLSGVSYDAVKIIIDFGSGKTYSMWFAKGMGLIKDSSSSGFSLFSDNNMNYNVVIKNSLIAMQK